jgi:dUTPase
VLRCNHRTTRNQTCSYRPKSAWYQKEALFIFPRSSLGIKKGLMMSNGVGVIDADYYNNPDNEGHIMVPL